MQNNKKLLLKIVNLKQYFPIKQKGMYVKANDGISVNIYEDETFGLVGESGCGKSTFGRSLLQLYQQTDGKTMYYGHTIDEVAPIYVKETLHGLSNVRKKQLELEGHSADAAKHLGELLGVTLTGDEEKVEIPEKFAGDKHIYEKLDEYYRVRKEAHAAFLNIVQIIGGFIVAPDLDAVAQLFLKKYELCAQRADMRRELRSINLQKEGVEYANKGKPSSDKLASVNAKIAQQTKLVDAKTAEINKAEAEIELARKKYSDNAEFVGHEKLRDNGIDLARLKYSEMRLLRSELQLIFQDPYSSLNPRMTVGQLIGEGLIAHGMFAKNDARMQEYILKIMDECGLAPYMVHRYPHQFSGGQRQRICIARSLAVRPKFVVCDEAVSALDVSIQSQILNLLMDLKEKDHLTYMFISHDLSVVKYISNRVGVMYLGNMVEMATSEALFRNPRHPYTEALLNAIPTTDIDSKLENMDLLEGDIPSPINPPKGCKFHTRCKYATDICKMVEPVFEEVEPDHMVACHHKLPDTSGKK